MQSSTLVCQNSAIFNSINSAILNPTNSAILNSFNSAILNSISSAILRHDFYKSSKILPEKILNAYIQFIHVAVDHVSLQIDKLLQKSQQMIHWQFRHQLNIKETVALILAQTKQKGDRDMDFDTNKKKKRRNNKFLVNKSIKRQ